MLMAPKRTRKTTRRKAKDKFAFSRIVLMLGCGFTVLLGLIKVLINDDWASWAGVFAPLIFAFVLVFGLRALGKLLSRL